ncbi:ABC transporter ATP-binding protein [Crossiella cryophila]|uniref:ABC-2 type transport system ATP-binding protein n=1 Tax=Crossiella cryophila TaxID=43355 RepID=A0A7W7C7J9_9PSEU|nr:ABC transporter ATP-binding protein [Crossiella cryophila]MBB4675917.1 ABC-2 type transport system ATP-binding protein [Crossiella cryophila]
MHDGSGRIVVGNLTKQFGNITAVQDLSFIVEPGTVTGFLGPNGSGKTTTLRMVLGLVRPSGGQSTINGVPYERLGTPGRVVGSVLEAQSFHPGRSARNHLKIYAAALMVPDERVDQVLQLVGLAAAADRRAGSFSLGMRQRLALATALLGDPQVLVLDEPANGLDPEGIAWLRTFLQSFARSGRTVLVSSHLLAEVEQTVDHVVIISRGRTVYNGGLDTLRQSQQSRVIVQPADPHKLVEALQAAGHTMIEPTQDGRLAITGVHTKQVADVALAAGVAIYAMQEEQVDLERLFFQLTSAQYTGAAPGQYPPPTPPGGGWGPPSGGLPAPTSYEQAYQQEQAYPPGYPQPQPPQPGYPPQPGQQGNQYGGNA